MTKNEITEVLKSSNAAVESAILRIYDNQTDDEQVTRNTHHDNGIGFNGPDARKMSYYAWWLKGGKYPGRYVNHLTGDYLADAKQRILKYAGQLEECGWEFQQEVVA